MKMLLQIVRWFISLQFSTKIWHIHPFYHRHLWSYFNTRTFRCERWNIFFVLRFASYFWFFPSLILVFNCVLGRHLKKLFFKRSSLLQHFYGLYDAICHHKHASYLDYVSHHIRGIWIGVLSWNCKYMVVKEWKKK